MTKTKNKSKTLNPHDQILYEAAIAPFFLNPNILFIRQVVLMNKKSIVICRNEFVQLLYVGATVGGFKHVFSSTWCHCRHKLLFVKIMSLGPQTILHHETRPQTEAETKQAKKTTFGEVEKRERGYCGNISVSLLSPQIKSDRKLCNTKRNR